MSTAGYSRPAVAAAASAVEALARSVVRAGGNALLIDADNKGGDWVSVAEAAASGEAFAVEIKRGLIALDLDTPELIALGEEARQLSEDSGLPTLLVNSGRNQHLYVRAEDQADDVAAIFQESLGILKSAFRKSIRPPLSPHRLGLGVGLIAPESVPEALGVLGPPESYPPLSTESWSLIRLGDTDGRFAGRSAVALSIANRMRLSGYSLAEFEAVMLNRSNLGGSKAHELDDEGRDVRRFLIRTWDKAGDAFAWTPDPIDEQIDLVVRAVEASEWPGQKGTSQRTLMLTLCRLGIEHQTTILAFGERGLSVEAQMSRAAVRNALEDLCKHRWLYKVNESTPGRTTNSDAYRLILPDKAVPPISRPPKGISGLTLSVGHPCFRNGSGLGKSPGRVWDYLRNYGPHSVTELARATGLSDRTIRRAVRRLSAYELADSDNVEWQAIGDESLLDRIADETGAFLTSERQQNVAATERKLYAERLTGRSRAPELGD